MKLKQINHNDLKFLVREGTSDYKAFKEVILNDDYQKKNFKILPQETWIDMGVNVGAFSVLALSKGCKVVGFEPDPLCANMAEKNVELNDLQKNYKLHKAGIVASKQKEGHLHLNTRGGNVWRNSFLKEWKGGKTIKVPLLNYKDFIEQDICIKMDIEGSEFEILEDMVENPAVLKDIKKLVFEWSFDIDPSLPRFCNVIDKLKQHYNVEFGVSDERYHRVFKKEPKWKDTWFPACITVFCMKK